MSESATAQSSIGKGMVETTTPAKNDGNKGLRYLRIRDAAVMYSVSQDFLRRNKAIPKVTIGRRMVRIDVNHLERYFKEREY